MPMQPSPRADTLRPVLPSTLRGICFGVEMDVALISGSVTYVLLATSMTRRADGVVNWEFGKRSEPRADAHAVYTEAARLRSTTVLIAGDHPSCRLKPCGELFCALGDSTAVAQYIAQPGGQLLPRAPQPRLQCIPRNAQGFSGFIGRQAFQLAQFKGIAQQWR